VKIFSPKLWLGAVAALGLGLLAQTAQTARAGFVDKNNQLMVYLGKTYTKTAAKGGTFQVADTEIQPTGTGKIDSFLRIQQDGFERGYNTSDFKGQAPPPPLDDVAGNFTHDITLGSVPIVKIGGVEYRAFLLDVNQDHNGNISLNQIQIFQSKVGFGAPGSTGIMNNEADATNNAILKFTSGQDEVFRLNNQAVTNSTYEIQVDTSRGSGSGDMFLYVLNSAFRNDVNSSITLFSQFGYPNGVYASSAGFEEWAVKLDGSGGGGGAGGGSLPAPAGLVLLASAVPMMAFRRVFRRKMAGN